jgi:MraZ protein
MSSIIGIENCKMDTTGRFKLPVALKKQLALTDDMRFVVRCSIYNRCLELFTYQSFQEEVTALKSKLNLYDPKSKRLFRKLTESNIVELDTNDRFLIPKEQRIQADIDKDIIVVSSATCMEIWNASIYASIDNDGFDYVKAAEELLKD